MSWLFSQALVAEYSAATCSDGEPYAQSSGNPTQLAYLSPDKMTAFSRLSRFGMTFKPLTENRGEELLTLYLEDSRARTYQQPEKAQELTESDQACGNTWRGWLARFDPDSCSWKTPQCSLLGEEQESLQTLPRWGMTRNGLLWEQPTLEPITGGIESGYSLPTPTCNPHLPNKNANTKGPKNLMEIAEGKWEHLMPKKIWPTPQASDNRNRGNADTPAIARRIEAGKQVMLTMMVSGGQLNPTWVEWLMGWPLGWTDLKPLVTGRFPCVRQQHGIFFKK